VTIRSTPRPDGNRRITPVSGVVRFSHDDRGFEDWMRANTSGYVLNFRDGRHGTLHHSGCRTFRVSPPREGITLFRPKDCADSGSLLRRWASVNGYEEPVWCELCTDREESDCVAPPSDEI
jgi:hypothetical protein